MKSLGILKYLIIATLVYVLAPQEAVASQQVPVQSSQLLVTSDLRSNYPVRTYKESIEELNRKMSLTIDNESIIDVISRIADGAGLGLAYDPEIDILDRKVSMDL